MYSCGEGGSEKPRPCRATRAVGEEEDIGYSAGFDRVSRRTFPPKTFRLGCDITFFFFFNFSSAPELSSNITGTSKKYANARPPSILRPYNVGALVLRFRDLLHYDPCLSITD